MEARVCYLQEYKTDAFTHTHTSCRLGQLVDPLIPHTFKLGAFALSSLAQAYTISRDSCWKWVSVGRWHVDGFQESHSPLPALSSPLLTFPFFTARARKM